MNPKMGEVYRMNAFGPFMDAVVHRINEDDKTVDLARPYCYASETGAPLVGVEMIRATFEHLRVWAVSKAGGYVR